MTDSRSKDRTADRFLRVEFFRMGNPVVSYVRRVERGRPGHTQDDHALLSHMKSPGNPAGPLTETAATYRLSGSAQQAHRPSYQAI